MTEIGASPAESQDVFKTRVDRALADEQLQHALKRLKSGFVEKRAQAVARMPEFEQLRDAATSIKNHVLANLADYLEKFESKVIETGGQVHWCADAEAARNTVLRICRDANARIVTKGKSMIAEEIGLNAHLAAHGIEPVETDLGEYIIQLAGETPSHIIAPAVHKSRDQVSALFHRAHGTEPRQAPEDLVREARAVLRRKFLDADVGITGANMLVAETGSAVIVTNEGNGDLTQTLPRVHIVVASVEKIVPTLSDSATMLRVLTRSATGQETTVYTTFATGPRRPGDLDGPEAFHVILLDNGRSALLGGDFHEILRCIRCGACLGHCPIYATIGGHAYGSVYSGPMGAVLTPALWGIEKTVDLPYASTSCGRCENVCPVRIPLPMLMRHWRERSFSRRIEPRRQRAALRLWAWFASRPRIYRVATGLAARILNLVAGRRGSFTRLPLIGGWTEGRDMPAPEGNTFHRLWRRRSEP